MTSCEDQLGLPMQSFAHGETDHAHYYPNSLQQLQLPNTFSAHWSGHDGGQWPSQEGLIHSAYPPAPLDSPHLTHFSSNVGNLDSYIISGYESSESSYYSEAGATLTDSHFKHSAQPQYNQTAMPTGRGAAWQWKKRSNSGFGHQVPLQDDLHTPSSRILTGVDSPVEQASGKPRVKGRQPHNLVEKKYRERFNQRIEELNEALAEATLKASDPTSGTFNSKKRKSRVLDDAITYVTQAEINLKKQNEEILRLKRKLSYLSQHTQLAVPDVL